MLRSQVEYPGHVKVVVNNNVYESCKVGWCSADAVSREDAHDTLRDWTRLKKQTNRIVRKI
jgi:hypothetical protein